jgi:hypothetical protein
MSRPALMIELSEAETLDEESLVLLSRGIAYAGAGSPAAMMLNFQRAVVSVPEEKLDKATSLPPLQTLVVDYASVYGLDCPSIDMLLLCDDLGQHLSFDDLQQFLGRLRRNGRVVFTSVESMLEASLGNGKLALAKCAAEYTARIAALLFAGAGGAVSPAPATEAEAKDLRVKVLRALELTGPTSHPLSDVFAQLAKALLATVAARAKPWAALLPWVPVFTRLTERDQHAILDTLYALLTAPEYASQAAAVADKLLIFLVNKEVLLGEEVVQWWQAKRRHSRAGGAVDAAIVKCVAELEEEDDDDDDDEDEEEGDD